MSTKKTAIVASFIMVIAIASANFASATEWTPLVRIPGLPPAGTVNLSMYLIGLYNFLLSIVGIVAVIMLIIGGMRYITAVGNPTAISSAKEIIMNAITGLILALLSWVFISTINPDVLFIKQPGSAGITDPGTGAQNLGTALPTTTSPSPCIAPTASNSPITVSGLTVCPCIDKAFVPASAGQNCQTVCAVSNCLVADARIGAFSEVDITNFSINELRTGANKNGTRENPFLFDDRQSQAIILEGEKFSIFTSPPAPTYDWDTNWDGIYDGINQPYIAATFSYDFIITLTNPKCYHNATPKSYICPTKFKITDSTGTKEDVLYFGWLEE